MKKIGRLIAGGLALICLYLFAIYLRTDSCDTARETIVLETDAVHSAQPSAAPSEAPENISVRAAADHTARDHIRRHGDKKHGGL